MISKRARSARRSSKQTVNGKKHTKKRVGKPAAAVRSGDHGLYRGPLHQFAGRPGERVVPGPGGAGRGRELVPDAARAERAAGKTGAGRVGALARDLGAVRGARCGGI